MMSLGKAPPKKADSCGECRRDFTINSLFYNINTSEVEDFTRRGLDDLLENRIIRTPMPASETLRDGEPGQETALCSWLPCLPAWQCLASDVLKQVCQLWSNTAVFADAGYVAASVVL